MELCGGCVLFWVGSVLCVLGLDFRGTILSVRFRVLGKVLDFRVVLHFKGRGREEGWGFKIPGHSFFDCGDLRFVFDTFFNIQLHLVRS